jgi:hypothetical protein
MLFKAMVEDVIKLFEGCDTLFKILLTSSFLSVLSFRANWFLTHVYCWHGCEQSEDVLFGDHAISIKIVNLVD